MPNDSKLGLLVGVAGVVIAAVLFYQDRSPAATAEPTAPVAGKSSQIFGKKPDSAQPSGNEPITLPARNKPEPDAQPVSRRTPLTKQ